MKGCPCGGHTVPASERKTGMVLKYERCGACGRCGGWRLSWRGEPVAVGEEARQQYRGPGTPSDSTSLLEEVSAVDDAIIDYPPSAA